MAQRSSRKRRKRRQRQARAAVDAPVAGGYARTREKDEAARAALEPLPEGERPTAVTVGAIVAALLTVAQTVAIVVGFDSDEPQTGVVGVFMIIALAVVAWGMWRARYWAVLGMQTILGLTIVVSTVALVGASVVSGLILVFAIILPSGILFWLLVKAMARIQMPERPGARR